MPTVAGEAGREPIDPDRAAHGVHPAGADRRAPRRLRAWMSIERAPAADRGPGAVTCVVAAPFMAL
jgi:hypothetical protein